MTLIQWKSICCTSLLMFLLSLSATPSRAAHLARPQEDKPRILCWILSLDTPENNKKSQAVQDTWAPRCDRFLVIKNGTQFSEQGHTLTLPIKQESRAQLWHKVIKTFEHVYANYLSQYDWFMKADDDTYVVVETLRKLLQKHRPEEPVYFGHKFKKFVRQGYMSGGSGYVLSREALRRLVELGFNKGLTQCHMESGQVEDVHMGQCLEAVSVKAGDSRDSRNRETFLPLAPQLFFDSNMTKRVPWFAQYSYYYSPNGHKTRTISNEPIAFHYMSPSQMRYTDFLLYQVKQLGGSAR